MREARRNPKHFARFHIERAGDRFSEGRASAPEVDGDIENPSLHDTDQLPLRRRRQLIMQSPKCSEHGTRQIVLNKPVIDSRLGEDLVAIDLLEEAPIVEMSLRTDRENVANRESLECE